MKLIIILLLLFSTPIEWSQCKLSIADFEAKTANIPGAVATTASEITLSTVKVNNKVYYDVKALFFPNDSYFNKQCLEPEYILKHEQIHFDITEYHARLLRIEIQKYQGKSIDHLERVIYLYDSLVVEWGKMQQRYDSETNNSINREKQKEWQLFIDGKNM